MDEDKKKKKKGKFSFLASLSSLGSGKSGKTKAGQEPWKGKAGSYFEHKKNKIRKLEKVFE